MLQALLAGGAMLQGLKAEMAAKAQQIGVLIACAIIALIFMLIGLIALGIASAVLLTPYLGAAGAWGVVGGVALLIGGIVILAGTRTRPAPRRVVAPVPLVAPVAAAPGPLEGLVTALPIVSSAVSAAPVPIMIGALALGIILGRRR